MTDCETLNLFWMVASFPCTTFMNDLGAALVKNLIPVMLIPGIVSDTEEGAEPFDVLVCISKRF